MKIGVLNYGLGNMGSVCSAFDFYGHKVVLISSESTLNEVDLIVISGVGHYRAAVEKIKKQKLWDPLNHAVLIKKIPILGICLGLQLFAEKSQENGEQEGFGWIRGSVIRLNPRTARVPHIGWNTVHPIQDRLFHGGRNHCFYFMHSYHLVPKDDDVIIANTSYGDSQFVSAIQKENLFGVQFHPEKSQGDGLRFLKNLTDWVQ